MRAPESTKIKILLVAAVTGVTLSAHYGWIVEPLLGHVHWFHAIHGRLCYIPIVIAASWFGIRGGLYVATAISILVLPYIQRTAVDTHSLSGEIAEIVFYYALALLIGALVEREFKSRRKQQETQLQAERVHKLSLVGQIAAGVAHEIKNPLASIKGAADILVAPDTSPEDRKEFREILQNEIRRIDTTVTAFLKFARPKELKLENISLSKTVRAAVRQMKGDAAGQGVSIETDIQDNVVVNGDPEKLQQMMLNLLLNAIQASKAHGVIRVALAPYRENHIQLIVVDSGEGMSATVLPHVFDPFFTTKPSGTGLGLPTVGEIIASHSGEIKIDSAIGKGTTVTVILPRLRVTEIQ